MASIFLFQCSCLQRYLFVFTASKLVKLLLVVLVFTLGWEPLGVNSITRCQLNFATGTVVNSCVICNSADPVHAGPDPDHPTETEYIRSGYEVPVGNKFFNFSHNPSVNNPDQ